MIKYITILFTLLATNSYSQTLRKDHYYLKQTLTTIGLLTAGFLDGQAEVLRYNFDAYKKIHPNTNPKWSDPNVSWINKYKNYPDDKREKYPGSKTVLAWTTDKYHLNRTLRNGLMVGSVSIFMSLYEKPKLKNILGQVIYSWGVYALGTGIAHKIYIR